MVMRAEVVSSIIRRIQCRSHVPKLRTLNEKCVLVRGHLLFAVILLGTDRWVCSSPPSPADLQSRPVFRPSTVESVDQERPGFGEPRSNAELLHACRQPKLGGLSGLLYGD